MKHITRRLAVAVMALLGSVASWAEVTTATWDFENANQFPSAKVNLQSGATGSVESDVEGIALNVTATGKFYSQGTYAQVNEGTTVQIPVKTTDDVVSVLFWDASALDKFTIGGVLATELVATEGSYLAEYKPKTAQVAAGYVELVAVGGYYIRNIKVAQAEVSKIKEKCLYFSDFTNWSSVDRKSATNVVKSFKTNYSSEELSFTLTGAGCEPNGESKAYTSSYVTDKGYLILAKYTGEYKNAEPFIETSALASVSKLKIVHSATGGSRGFVISVKGDGDADWVTLHNKSIANASGETLEYVVNRTNCKIKFSSFSLGQNSYMDQIYIYGMVDFSSRPVLAQFDYNGTTVYAGDDFDEAANGSYVATFDVSKTDAMVNGVNNPVTEVVAENGDIQTIGYETSGEGFDKVTKVTIPVKFGADTKNYVATFKYKKDFVLSYYDVDGTTLLCTQNVEAGKAIGQYSVEAMSNVSIANGKVFSGWFTRSTSNVKIGTDFVVTKNISLFAQQKSAEYPASITFQLNDSKFSMEENSAYITSVGKGVFHDGTHGWVFLKDDELKINVPGPCTVSVSACQYSKDVITVSGPDIDRSLEVPADGSDGMVYAIDYTSNQPGVVTLKFNTDQGTYVHYVKVDQKSLSANACNYYMVKAGDAASFLSALSAANASNAAANAERVFIFLPNGTYDLGETALTTISGNNISIIGESQEGTVILNYPHFSNEGIGTTATLFNKSNGLYMQDLTLQNALDYYKSGSAGRAVCLQDEGANTICKNVTMLSYQDTYYSHKPSKFYWEDCEIHGTVDYLCGDGDVIYNRCLLVNESRSASGASGETTVAAPYQTAGLKWGYVFLDCTIDVKSATFNLGRSWGGDSQLKYIRTVLKQPSKLASGRFTASGMNIAAYGFYEYGTLDEQGKVISPASNVVKFTHASGDKQYETILTAEQAAEYTVANIFGDWAPDAKCAQLVSPAVSFADGVSSWSAVEGALAYLVYVDGVAVDVVPASQTTYEASNVSVRVANSMGGFSKLESYTVKYVSEEGAELKPAAIRYAGEGAAHVTTAADQEDIVVGAQTYAFSRVDAEALSVVFAPKTGTAEILFVDSESADNAVLKSLDIAGLPTEAVALDAATVANFYKNGRLYECTSVPADVVVPAAGTKASFNVGCKALKANYSVVAVDVEGNAIADAVVMEGYVGDAIKPAASDCKDITIDNAVYYYLADNSYGLTVAEDNSAILRIVFEKRLIDETAPYVVKFVDEEGNVLAQATRFGVVGTGIVASETDLADIVDGSNVYNYLSSNAEGLAVKAGEVVELVLTFQKVASADALDSIDANDVRSVLYFDLNGRSLRDVNDGRGVVIRREFLSNGEVRTQKLLVR